MNSQLWDLKMIWSRKGAIKTSLKFKFWIKSLHRICRLRVRGRSSLRSLIGGSWRLKITQLNQKTVFKKSSRWALSKAIYPDFRTWSAPEKVLETTQRPHLKNRCPFLTWTTHHLKTRQWIQKASSLWRQLTTIISPLTSISCMDQASVTNLRTILWATFKRRAIWARRQGSRIRRPAGLFSKVTTSRSILSGTWTS